MPSSKELLLESLVAEEVARIIPKLNFWNISHSIQAQSLWKRDDSLTLDRILPEFNDGNIDSYEAKLLCCIGWEFIWGKVPPKFVNDERRSLIAKDNSMSPLEELWKQLIAVDTDMF